MNDRGSVTLVALSLCSLLVLVSAGLVAVGRVLAAHYQATAAADAAALAAAPLTFLPGDPLREAAQFASANDARLIRCACPKDGSFRVRVARVEVANAIQLPFFGQVTVRARAAAEFDPMQLLG